MLPSYITDANINHPKNEKTDCKKIKYIFIFNMMLLSSTANPTIIYKSLDANEK